MAKILLVEDDIAICEQASDWFTAQNHCIEVAQTGREARQKMFGSHYDVVVLDLTLPDADGLSLLKEFRCTEKTPVLVLTGKSDIEMKEKALDAGADDYVLKPFLFREIAARIRSLLRRTPYDAPNVISAGSMRLDVDNHIFMRGDTQIHLQPRECAIVELLMRYPSEPFSIQALMSRIWRDDNAAEETVRVHMMKLREKLGEPCPLETLRGVGYRFNDSL